MGTPNSKSTRTHKANGKYVKQRDRTAANKLKRKIKSEQQSQAA